MIRPPSFSKLLLILFFLLNPLVLPSLEAGMVLETRIGASAHPQHVEHQDKRQLNEELQPVFRHAYDGNASVPLNWYYQRARYRALGIKRWASRDPIGFAGGWNFSSLFRSSPLSRIDPLGLSDLIMPGADGPPLHHFDDDEAGESLLPDTDNVRAENDDVTDAVFLIMADPPSGALFAAGGVASAFGHPTVGQALRITGIAVGLRGLVVSGGRLIARACKRTTLEVDIALKYKPGWSEAQRADAARKAKILNDSETIVTTEIRRSRTSASRRYRRGGNVVPSGSDVDHRIDLQLGGPDALSNMWPLDSSVNRSLGIQVSNQIRHLPSGTRVNRVTIGD